MNWGKQLLGFRLGDARLAVPVALVDEIIEWETVTPIPLAPDYLPGLVTWRGKPVPLLLLARFLRMEGADGMTPRERALVVSVDGMRVALVCDRVDGMVEEPGEANGELRITRTGAVHSYATSEFLVDDDLIVSLDVSGLLRAARPEV